MRAWYDSHFLVDISSNTDSNVGGAEAEQRVLTSEDVDRFQSSLEASFQDFGYGDDFCDRCSAFFDRLAKEEDRVLALDGKEFADYPPFARGSSTRDQQVIRFYAHWSTFSTYKSFPWIAAFPIHEAPDRRTRRMMEKSNQRVREEAIRSLNLSVRSLVAFIKRKDPRYTCPRMNDRERNEELRHISATQASKSRSEHQATLQGKVVPDWTKSQSTREDLESSEEEENTRTKLECLLCRKVFWSENQYASHARSKKHLKLQQVNERGMLAANATRNADTATQVTTAPAEQSWASDVDNRVTCAGNPSRHDDAVCQN